MVMISGTRRIGSEDFCAFVTTKQSPTFRGRRPTCIGGAGLSRSAVSIPKVVYQTLKETHMTKPVNTDVDTTSINPQGKSEVQGEGNYDATRRYDKSAREFVQSGKVEDAARSAQPKNAEEAEAMQRAEREGKSHSKGEDPQLFKKSPTDKK
jgi:hypothetical protein